MAGIKDKNSKPEMIMRRGLHRLGFGFRLHNKDLPGRPDLVFRKFDSVIFVNGCLWHGHGCHLLKWPKTRRDFWRSKIEANIARDRDVCQKLDKLEIDYLTVWECELRSNTVEEQEKVIEVCASWLDDILKRKAVLK